MSLDYKTLFAPIIGLPCWNVKPGYGTFLTLEFGEPIEHVREPIESDSKNARVRELLAKRHVSVHGEWHLWIYGCRWRVFVGEQVVGYSDLEGSTKYWMENAAVTVDGKTLTAVALDPQRVTSVFTFSEDTRLETEPYDDESEQWNLYMPDGYVLCFEADGSLTWVHEDDPVTFKSCELSRELTSAIAPYSG
jgi:hypothetical protein